LIDGGKHGAEKSGSKESGQQGQREKESGPEKRSTPAFGRAQGGEEGRRKDRGPEEGSGGETGLGAEENLRGNGLRQEAAGGGPSGRQKAAHAGAKSVRKEEIGPENRRAQAGRGETGQKKADWEVGFEKSSQEKARCPEATLRTGGSSGPTSR
jgi:hypothetical protein